MQKFLSFFDGLDKIFNFISGVTLFIMMIWIFLDVMLRFVFNSPIQGTIEITGEYLMVLLVYLAISSTQKYDEHIKVTILLDRFPEMAKKITKFITNILGAILFVYIAVFNFQSGLDYMEQNIRSAGVLNYPLAPALFIISIGLFMITLRLVLECISILFPKALQMKEPVGEDENLTHGV